MVSKDQSGNVKKNVSLFKLVTIPLFHRFGLLDLSTHEKIIIIS